MPNIRQPTFTRKQTIVLLEQGAREGDDLISRGLKAATPLGHLP